MNILLIFAALCIGLSLGIFGSGGSILTVPVLVYLADQDPKAAIAGSLLVVGSISLVSSLFNRGKATISWPHIFWFGIPSMTGTYLGAYFANFFSGVIQLFVFGLVMLAAVKVMWQSQPAQEQQGLKRHKSLIIIDGLVVGVITGFVGVGGGFLIVPALVILGGLSFIQATATSLIIISLKSFVGFAKYLSILEAQAIHLDWNLLFLLIFSGLLGSVVGQKFAGKMPQAQLKKGFALFLLMMAIFIIYKTSAELINTLEI